MKNDRLCPLCRRGFESFAGGNGAARHVIIEHKRTPEEADALFMDAKNNGMGIAVSLALAEHPEAWAKDS